MKTRQQDISSKEAAQIAHAYGKSFSHANLADMLHIPEAEVEARLQEMRRPVKRHFVDRGGAVSALIAAALFLGFSIGKSIYFPTNISVALPASTGTVGSTTDLVQVGGLKTTPAVGVTFPFHTEDVAFQASSSAD